MKYNFIVFDWDGTLLASDSLIFKAISEAFVENNLWVPSIGDIRKYIGLPVSEILNSLLPEHTDIDIDILCQSFDNFYKLYSKSEVSYNLFPGVFDMLKLLKDKGYDMAVCTGKSKNGVLVDLNNHNLKNYFIDIATSSEGFPMKPNNLLLNDLIHRCNKIAEDTIVIGDTTMDIAMANSSNCISVGVNWGYHEEGALRKAGANYIANNINKLISIIEQLG